MIKTRTLSFSDPRFTRCVDRWQPPAMQELNDAAELIRLAQEGGLDMEAARVPADELTRARTEVSDAFHTAVLLAMVNLRKFHEQQRTLGYVHDDGDGVRLIRSVRPCRRAAIVCAAPDCAELLMRAVPARVAGVEQITLAVSHEGGYTEIREFLAAAKVLGIEEVYCMPADKAVAAYARAPGVRADCVCGPCGAARGVRLLVGLPDEAASLSDLLIVADPGAIARSAALDLLVAAKDACPADMIALITPDRLFAEAVRIEMMRITEHGPFAPDLCDVVQNHGGIWLCHDMDEAVQAVNLLAPARLGLLTADNQQILQDVDNAGLVYCGCWSSEAAAGGFSGACALAPGGGLARCASTPGVSAFVRESTIVEYTQQKLAVTGRHMLEITKARGRPAGHAALLDRMNLIRMAQE